MKRVIARIEGIIMNLSEPLVSTMECGGSRESFSRSCYIAYESHAFSQEQHRTAVCVVAATAFSRGS